MKKQIQLLQGPTRVSVPKGDGSTGNYLAVVTRSLGGATGLSLLDPQYRAKGGRQAELAKATTNFDLYKKNFLIRGAIDSLAEWTGKEGFETVLESALDASFPSEEEKQAFLERAEYQEAKAYVDNVNKNADLDTAIVRAVTWAKIEGRAPFEIVFKRPDDPWGNENPPVRLNPLTPTMVEPNIDPDTWAITSYDYSGKKAFYDPGELLYFVNSDLVDDRKGMSAIEPVMGEAQLDTRIIREDLLEAATTLWAGVVVWLLDLDKCKGMTPAQIDKFIEDHLSRLKPGKHLATDNRWSAIPVTMDVHVERLLEISERMERRILGNFKVPRFIMNLEKDINRATAYAAFEAFIQGPIGKIQQWLKRDIERQWYDPLVRQFLKLGPSERLPIRLTHNFREIRTADWFELLAAAAQAYGQGMGPIGQKKFYEIMQKGQRTSFDPKELEEAAASRLRAGKKAVG